MCRWQCQSPRRRNLVQKYRFGKLLWWKNRVDHFWSLSREDACCKRWRPEGHRVPSSAANTRFDSLDLDFSFFLEQHLHDLYRRGDFSAFFLSRNSFSKVTWSRRGVRDGVFGFPFECWTTGFWVWHRALAQKKWHPPKKGGTKPEAQKDWKFPIWLIIDDGKKYWKYWKNHGRFTVIWLMLPCWLALQRQGQWLHRNPIEGEGWRIATRCQ